MIHSTASFGLLSEIKVLAYKLFMAMALSAVAILFASCIIGGTGTDTDNGVKEDKSTTGNSLNDVPAGGISLRARVIDTAGLPVSGVFITAAGTTFRPDSGQNISMEVLVAREVAQKQIVTSAKGEASFVAKGMGTYVVEGSKDGRTLFYDTLKILDTNAQSNLTYRVGPSRLFQGKVKLTSGMHIDSGKVFIRGTRRFVKIDASGAYDLGLLPINASGMGVGVRFVASPTAVLEVRSTLAARDPVVDKLIPPVQGFENFKLVYTCKDLAPDSAKKISNPVNLTPPSAEWVDSTKNAFAVQSVRDSVKIRAVFESCDSIPRGALVSLSDSAPNFQVSMQPPSRSISFLVSEGNTTQVNVAPSHEVSLDKVVLYGKCVESPGTEKTTFDVTLTEPGVGSSDLIVEDLPSGCLKP